MMKDLIGVHGARKRQPVGDDRWTGAVPSGGSSAPDDYVRHRAMTSRWPRWGAGHRLLGHRAAVSQRPGGRRSWRKGQVTSEAAAE
jgi:hypothetical protein